MAFNRGAWPSIPSSSPASRGYLREYASRADSSHLRRVPGCNPSDRSRKRFGWAADAERSRRCPLALGGGAWDHNSRGGIHCPAIRAPVHTSNIGSPRRCRWRAGPAHEPGMCARLCDRCRAFIRRVDTVFTRSADAPCWRRACYVSCHAFRGASWTRWLYCLYSAAAGGSQCTPFGPGGLPIIYFQ